MMTVRLLSNLLKNKLLTFNQLLKHKLKHPHLKQPTNNQQKNQNLQPPIEKNTKQYRINIKHKPYHKQYTQI